MRIIKRIGFTLPELLVVVAIISILSAILVPTIAGKVELARVAAAKRDISLMIQAEESCLIDNGFYIALRVLDDVPDSRSGNRSDDRINNGDEYTYVIDPFIALDRQISTQGQILTHAARSGESMEYYYTWGGPYLNFQRAYQPDSSINDYRDMPLDPWGIPYKLYTAEGYTGGDPDSRSGGGFLYSDYDGRIGTSGDKYDRYTIVSSGKNRLFGTSLDDDDDKDNVFASFGTYTNASAYKPVF